MPGFIDREVPAVVKSDASESPGLDEPSMIRWGEAIGRSAVAPLVLTLSGDLGAGKTTLARAIGRGAGVRGAMPSPTYNLLFRYPTDRGFNLVHIDLYRLDREDDVWELGWSELPAEDEIVLIEWPARAQGLLPSPRWDVVLTEADDPALRTVVLKAVGGPAPIVAPAQVV
jgi:tRNA threonylcarbamoyladenosine biosynthesis protein TsaE